MNDLAQNQNISATHLTERNTDGLVPLQRVAFWVLMQGFHDLIEHRSGERTGKPTKINAQDYFLSGDFRAHLDIVNAKELVLTEDMIWHLYRHPYKVRQITRTIMQGRK